MKMTRRLLGLALALMIFAGMPVMAEDNLKYLPKSEEAEFFNMISSDLVDLYQFDITKDKLLERTFTNLLNNDPEALDTFLRALFNSLDPYSEFYSPEEYKQMMQSLEGVTGGIGIRMLKGSQYVEVADVIDNSPALSAGIQAGDKIIKVNGEDVSGKGEDYVGGKVRGEIGTDVTLTLLRGTAEIEITLTRGELVSNTAEYAFLSDDVAYLRILSFSSATEAEVNAALKSIDERGVKKIILDLRNNLGGYVDSAVNIAKNFVPEGIIAKHYTKVNGKTEEYVSDLKATKYELVTLVNEYTASAAELLASALQDSGASKLIGRQTYGKAVTQAIMQLYGGRMCKVTSGEYITRNGKKINNIGIIPDTTVDNRIAVFSETNAGKMKYAPQYKQGDTGEGIYLAKLRLEALDYALDTSQDTYDEAMTHAVKAYQESAGLDATGVLDINTQICLDNDASEQEVLIDLQTAAAFEYFDLEYDGFRIAEK